MVWPSSVVSRKLESVRRGVTGGGGGGGGGGDIINISLHFSNPAHSLYPFTPYTLYIIDPVLPSLQWCLQALMVRLFVYPKRNICDLGGRNLPEVPTPSE